VSGGDNCVRILDADCGKELLAHDQRIEPTLAFSNSAVFASDRNVVASALGERIVELWDAYNGKTIRRLELPEQKGQAAAPDGGILTVELGVNPSIGAFSSDGSLLAVKSGHRVELFDLATGKSRVSIPLESAGGRTLPTNSPRVLALNGTVLATAWFSNTISLWDLNTGKRILELVGKEGTVSAISFSPEGRILASCTGSWGKRGFNVKGRDYGDHNIQLWVPSTGDRLLTIKGHTDNVRSVTYSPDGRFLVSGGEDNTIRVWEAVTGQQLLRWDMSEIVNEVAVSPDNTKVAAVLHDGSVTLLPIDDRQTDKARPQLDGDAFDRLWHSLGSENAAAAHTAVRDLSESGGEPAARIGKRLKAVPAAPPADIYRLIADLGTDDFDRREAASKGLAALGPQAESGLRKALKETDSDEVRARIRPLLKALDEWVVTDPDMLRALRAIWVLERIGTPEARAVLEDLAKGAPEARQTQEAKNALDFLDKRAAAAKP
jgi:DNA-binding beta-propeller fold protein YncE